MKSKNNTNSLIVTHPELVAQWHPFKNGDFTPNKATKGQRRKVWWLLPYDVPMDYHIEHLRGKHFDFEWEATISHRAEGKGCPFLSCPAKAVWKGFNDLATTHPHLAAEWHPFKNGNITPDMISKGYDKKVWWYLPYDVPLDYPVEHLRGKHFDFEWETTANSRASYNLGCPYLSNQLLWVGFNDLATTSPELALQWHPTKNGGLKPTDVMAGSVQKVWWILPYDAPMDYPIVHLRGKHFNFEWKAEIGNRANGHGCPYLTGHAIWRGFNDLSTTHPELVEEWDLLKNQAIKPFEVMAGGMQKVWWKCKDGHEWKALINHRTKGSGCPFCKESKGEKAIKKVLIDNNIDFEEQYKFKDRTLPNSKRLLRDDFALFDRNKKIVGTIEYHGKQHYSPVDFGSKGKAWAQKELEKTQFRDKVKSNYLSIHNIPQLIIPYWEFDNIEKIINDFIVKLPM